MVYRGQHIYIYIYIINDFYLIHLRKLHVVSRSLYVPCLGTGAASNYR